MTIERTPTGIPACHAVIGRFCSDAKVGPTRMLPASAPCPLLACGAVPTSSCAEQAHTADSGLDELQLLISERDRPMHRVHVAVIEPASNKKIGFGSAGDPGYDREASMNRKTVGIVFALGVGVAMLAGSASAQNSPASAAIDASLRGAVERGDVPGVVALITDRDRVLYQGAFGVADVATGRSLNADALFRIASMTKAITSVALMQLVEQGRLGLDDPAEKYLAELAGLKVFESFDAATGA